MQWLKNPQIIKIRNKKLDWTREDIVSLCIEMFATTDISNKQLSVLINKLQDPATTKPETIHEISSDIEVKTVYTSPTKPRKKSMWLRRGKYAMPYFIGLPELYKWISDVYQTSNYRDNWFTTLNDYKKSFEVSVVDKDRLIDIDIDLELSNFLDKRSKANLKLSTPLPNNSNINKLYWGLETGDKLQNKDGTWLVTEVRPSIDSPPTVVIKLNETS